MIIKTYEKDYYIIQRLEVTQDFERLICEEILENSRPKYIIIKIFNRDMAYKVIPFFTTLKENKTFEDYKDCFSKEGEFYLVFLYNEGKNLQDKLKDEYCTLRERIEIMKKILEKIVIFDIPYYFIYDLIKNNNIMISDALEVFYNYSLLEYKEYENIGIKNINEVLANLYNDIFKIEIKNNSSNLISGFYKSLQEQKYNNYIQIYQDYNILYNELINNEKINLVRPNSIILKIWDRIKKTKKYLKPLFIIIVLISVIGYMIFVSITDKKKEGIKFEYIGDLNLKKNDETFIDNNTKKEIVDNG